MKQDTPNKLPSGNSKTSILNNSLSLPAVIGLVIITGVVAFTGGMAFSKDKASDSTPDTAMSADGSQAFGMGMGGRSPRSVNGTMGEVTAVSADSISVKSAQDNTTATYAITSSTNVLNGSSTASVSDIKTSDTVLVQASSSDNKTATRIILNPEFRTRPDNNTSNPPSEDGSSTSGDNI